jgi:potassium efflux system protein
MTASSLAPARSIRGVTSRPNRVFWILLCSLLSPISASGQETDDTTRPAQQDTASAVIDASQIARAVEDATARLLEIRSVVEPTTEVLTIDSSLSSFSQSLERLRQSSHPDRLGDLSLRALDDLDTQWHSREEQLGRIRSALEIRSRVLEQTRDSLASMRTAWQNTRASAAEQELPPATVHIVQTVLDGIDEVEAALGERRQRVLTLLNEVSQQGSIVAQGEVDLAAAYSGARRRLLTPDSPPMWRSLGSQRDTIPLSQQLRDSWKEKASSLRDFAKVQQQEIVAFAALFALLLLGVAALRRSSRHWSADADTLHATVYIVSRPVSTAALLSLATIRLFFPFAPTVVLDIAQVLWIIPLFRLIPGVLEPRMHRSAYGVLVLWELLQASDLLDQPHTLRGVLFVVTGLTLAGLGVLLKPSGWLRQPQPVRWSRALVATAKLALLLLGISIVANVVGLARLSWLLTEGVLAAGAAGVAAFILARVTDGIALVLLNRGPARWLRSIKFAERAVGRRTTAIIHAAALFLWLFAVLRSFQILDPIVGASRFVLTRQWSLGSWQLSLGNVIAFVLTLWFAVWVSRALRAVLREDVFPVMGLARGVPTTISALIHYGILTVGFLVAAGAAGFNLGSIAIIAGALGVGIGFGLQNIVNNFISGLILMFERPIQIGDTIELDTLLGEVRRIGIRASTVRTFDGAEVIVPNADLVSGRVVNWTLSDKLRRIEVAVGVKYGTDPKRVLQLLVAAAKQHPDVLEEPEPFALFVEFGESSLNFVLRFWTANFDFWRTVMSEVTVTVNTELAKAGIEIPFPQRDLHLKTVGDPAAQALSGTSSSKSESA